ncbi:MAG TPA: hypothetical protein VK966_01910, partial [Longimicrobiales bacterium]|nr:hypothetical protein [Longimicrobiales bacterium]
MAARIFPLALLLLVAAACGEPEADPGTAADTSELSLDTPDEEPGLPVDSTRFEPTQRAGAEGLTGTLWLSTSQPEDQDGLSLIAQLEGVPTGQAYSWALHAAACGEPDDVLLPLGYGTEAATQDDRAREGGPLGQTRAAFEPTADGRLEETVWIPLNGAL